MAASRTEEPPIHWVVPELEIVQLRNNVLLSKRDTPEFLKAWDIFIAAVKEKHLLGMYIGVLERLNMEANDAVVSHCEKELENRVRKVEEKIKEAETNYGEAEIVDAMVEKGHIFAETGDVESAIEEYLKVAPKLLGSEGRAINALNIARLCLLFDTKPSKKKKHMEYARNEIEKNGDWEKRNKFKIYSAVMNMYERSLEPAAATFLEALATYSAVELIPFNKYVEYTILLNILTVDRPILKKSLVFSPEVTQICLGNEMIKEFMMSYYNGRYADFFKTLIKMADGFRQDQFLSRHYLYIIRLVRLKAYSQFLEPFRSVTIDKMADSFGISREFLEEELSNFISSDKLPCKIDKVSGIISRNTIDQSSILYQQIIKEGDALLNNIERLTKIMC